jgi:hypothetical protein
VAALYCSATLAEIRPRSLTVMPWSFAHARMSALRSRLDAVRPGRRRGPRPARRVLDERRELPTERRGVLSAQIDLVLGAAQPEPHRLIRRASIKVVFQRDGYLLCHPGLPGAIGQLHRTRSTL